eukprot:TRINITY_DN29581_c0_g1_i1.p1 TRINITY_DN29581_c0_g1~~TRINITY_DN29581_c0_g1_i1.p1  ORF type:complete len:348 (+),score=74.88 TRINITY_DN29581_c0_g1_i1:26-1045(+)
MCDIAVNSHSICKYCKDPKKIRTDASQGTLVCTGCGLVLADRCLDDGREWRNFASEGVDSQAPSRERADHTTAFDVFTGGLGTTVLGAGHEAQRLQQLGRMAQNHNAPELTVQQKRDKLVQHHADKARQVASRLNLGEPIVNRCKSLLQELAARGTIPSKAQAAWHCALVHLACSQEGCARTSSELAAANHVACGKTQADLEKIIQKRIKQLCTDLQMETLPSQRYVEDEELMKRCAMRLELSHEVIGPARHVVREAERAGAIKRSQGPFIAAAIMIVAWLLDVPEKPRFEKVAAATKETEASVKDAYKKVYTNLRTWLPPPEEFKPLLKLGLQGMPQV